MIFFMKTNREPTQISGQLKRERNPSQVQQFQLLKCFYSSKIGRTILQRVLGVSSTLDHPYQHSIGQS